MDDYIPTPTCPSVFVYMESMPGVVKHAETMAYWDGLMWGYALALLTTIVVIAILNCLHLRRGNG